jgi:nucleoside-diphosphate-sugar epimerase
LVKPYANLTPKEYAFEIAFSEYGWGKAEQKCLAIMWGKEAGWDYTAISPTDDYGIPQRHMRNNTQEEIDAFMQNPQTQIAWGLNYIQKRYSSPCQAWAFWQENRWY